MDKLSCSKTNNSESAGGESLTSITSILSSNDPPTERCTLSARNIVLFKEDNREYYRRVSFDIRFTRQGFENAC